MASEASDDLNFKMSKKIAQLTKVIYQLNCRNEDSDAFAKSVADRYENEISVIMSDAKTKLTALRDALNAKNDDATIKRIIADMTKLHEKEKTEATRAFDEFRERCIRNEQAMKQNFEERIVSMTRDLTQSKEDFLKTIRELKDVHASSSASGKKDLDELLARKNKEIDDLVKEYNERYKAMLSEQLDAQDQLEKRLNDEWGAKVAALQAQLSGKTTDMQRMLAEAQERLAKSEESLKAANIELGKRQQTIDEKATEVTRLKQRVEHFESTVTTLSAQLKKSEELCEAQKGKIASVENELSEWKKRFLESEKLVAELRLQLSKTESMNVALENEKAVLQSRVAALEVEVQSLKDQASQLDSAGSNMGSEIARLKGEVTRTDGLLQDERKKSASLQEVIDKLTVETKRLEETMRAQKSKSDDELAELKRNFDAKLASLQSNSSASADALAAKHQAELEALRTKLKKEMDTAVAALEDGHRASMSVAEKRHADAVLDLQTKSSTALAKEQAEHRADVAKETSRRETEVAALEQRIAELSAKLSGDAKSLQDELLATKKALEELRSTSQRDRDSAEAQLQAVKAEHEVNRKKWDLELTDIKAQRDRERTGRESAELRVKTLEEKIQALEAQHAKALASAAEAHAKQLADAVAGSDREGAARLRSQLDQLRNELTAKFENEKQSLTAEHSRQLETLRGQLLASQADVARLNGELDRLRDAQSQSSLSSSQQLEALRQQLDAARREYEAALQKLNREHDAELSAQLRELEAKHSTAMKDASDSHATAIKEYEARLLRIGDDARLAQRDMEENFKNRLSSLEKRKDEERERAVQDANARGEKTAADLQLRLEKETEDVRQAKHVVEREVIALTAEIQSLQQKLATSQKRLEESNIAHATTRMEADAAAAAAAQRLAAAQQTHESAIAELRESHEANMKSQADQFETEKKQLLAKIKQLQKLVADLEYKYANRESRQEDVDKINQLLKETKEKDEALVKAYHDMKFYKLELVNREESYNKVFGRQPNVATTGAGGTAAAADSVLPQAASAMQLKPQQNPSSAPAKMDNANMPPNMKRKSVV